MFDLFGSAEGATDGEVDRRVAGVWHVVDHRVAGRHPGLLRSAAAPARKLSAGLDPVTAGAEAALGSDLEGMGGRDV